MELTFLAQGSVGDRPDRRRPSHVDASSGGQSFAAPQPSGGLPGMPPAQAGEGQVARSVGASARGEPRLLLGRGARDGAVGANHTDEALVPLARPSVPQGTPSVPAAVRSFPRDNVDSEQESAALVQLDPSRQHGWGTSGARERRRKGTWFGHVARRRRGQWAWFNGARAGESERRRHRQRPARSTAHGLPAPRARKDLPPHSGRHA